jgi:hypothetical protein
VDKPNKLRRGQTREDGKLFWHYTGHPGAANQERWLTPEEFELYRRRDREAAADRRTHARRFGMVKSEIDRAGWRGCLDLAAYALKVATSKAPQ